MDASIAPWTLSRVGYYFDLFAYPLAALGLVAVAAIDGSLRIAWLVAFVTGWLVWTLAEYLIHRVVFHGPLAALHDEHHRRPPAYIGVPAYWTAIVFLALGLLPAELALGDVLGRAFFAGLIAGYAAYIIVHDRYHHAPFRPGSWAHGLQIRHNAHHRGGHENFAELCSSLTGAGCTVRPRIAGDGRC